MWWSQNGINFTSLSTFWGDFLIFSQIPVSPPLPEEIIRFSLKIKWISMRVIWLRYTALRRTRLIIYSCHAPWCRLQMNALKNDEVEKSAGNLCACKLLSFFFVSTGTITCARGCQNFRWPSKNIFHSHHLFQISAARCRGNSQTRSLIKIKMHFPFSRALTFLRFFLNIYLEKM